MTLNFISIYSQPIITKDSGFPQASAQILTCQPHAHDSDVFFCFFPQMYQKIKDSETGVRKNYICFYQEFHHTLMSQNVVQIHVDNVCFNTGQGTVTKEC